MPFAPDWHDLAASFVQSSGDDHWQQLGVGGTLAVVVLAVVLQFVLKFTSIRRETKPAPVNGAKSGERSVEYWEKTIGDLIGKCVEKEVTPKLSDLTIEMRAMRDILNEMKVRGRS